MRGGGSRTLAGRGKKGPGVVIGGGTLPACAVEGRHRERGRMRGEGRAGHC